MKATTLAALKGSIKKWERIVAGTGGDRAAKNCPLCKLFIKKNCDGCPVKDRVNKSECAGTPWQRWARTQWGDLPWMANTADQKSAASAELKFLRSLLPVRRTRTKSAKRKAH